ncbi:MAG TPA: SDR family NAD(P)-dependent oxidoreductase, partial [Candidatus Binatus sp.]|nr:SDR family NAD(P)-dependent oxidoreductase [Candidatus Binatus sp.]
MILQGQVALVTGASRGIGRAIALSLSRAGSHVIVNYRGNQGAATESLNAITTRGGQGELCAFDIADENQVDAAVKAIVDRHKKIDILVNNAGVTADGLLMRMKPADWDQVVGTNLKGTVNCTKAVSRFMIRQHGGRI